MFRSREHGNKKKRASASAAAKNLNSVSFIASRKTESGCGEDCKHAATTTTWSAVSLIEQERELEISLGKEIDRRHRPHVETELFSRVLESLKEANEVSLKRVEKDMFPKNRSSKNQKAVLPGTIEKDVFPTLSGHQARRDHHVENLTFIDHFGDRGIYTGDLCNGEPHGYGEVGYTDQRCYKGEWVEGKYQGTGTMLFANGDTYLGEYFLDAMDGTGTYQWNDGREYVGEFSADERHGQGTYTWPDGSSYHGSFRSGQFHGFGIHIDKNGFKLQGQFRNGRYREQQEQM